MMFILGLDLGQAQDYSTLAIVEFIQRTVQSRFGIAYQGKREPADLHCRHIQRFSLGTPYPVIVQEVRDLMRKRPLLQDCELVVDQTGVGKPVMDMLKQHELSPIGITITGGNSAKGDGNGGYMVPKRDLVGTIQVLLQSDRLKLAKEMPDVDKLIEELLHFQVKITVSGNDTYEAWRNGSHDDMVLALALGCWYGEEYCYRAPPHPPIRRWFSRQI